MNCHYRNPVPVRLFITSSISTTNVFLFRLYGKNLTVSTLIEVVFLVGFRLVDLLSPSGV